MKASKIFSLKATITQSDDMTKAIEDHLVMGDAS